MPKGNKLYDVWNGWEIDKLMDTVILTSCPVCFCVSKAFLKKIEFFFSLLQINIFLVFLDHFDALISKMIFKK
jgi:hypothetical protein